MNLDRIIITGHNGFIGRYLAKSLINKKRIIGISNKIHKDLDINQIQKDIRKITPKLFTGNISCIIHLAAMTGVDECQKFPEACFQTNVVGTQKMLEVARKKNCKFLFVSTSHVYGIPSKLLVAEDDPKNPISIYSASKLAAEHCCEAYSKTYGIDVAIIRLFSVYGPGSSNYNVVNRIVSQLLTKDTIMMGNLYPKRDFVYITDAVQAINIVMKKMKGFDTYNVGTGKSYSIGEVGELLKKISRKNTKIKSIKSFSRKLEIENIYANSKKLKNLGWKPMIPLKVGLKKTLSGEKV